MSVPANLSVWSDPPLAAASDHVCQLGKRGVTVTIRQTSELTYFKGDPRHISMFPVGSSKISWNELGARLPYWGASHNEVLLDHLYITAAEAAEILGMSLEEFETSTASPPIWSSVGTSVCATGGQDCAPAHTSGT